MEDEEDESIPVEVKIADQIGEFDEVVVWGHAGEVDAEQDMFVRGLKEWVGFAESMHLEGDEEVAADTKTEEEKKG